MNRRRVEVALAVLLVVWVAAVTVIGQAPDQVPAGGPVDDVAAQPTAPDATPATPVDPAASLPDGPGKELVARICVKCHVFERIAVRRADQAEWQEVINLMIQRGAEVYTEEEFYTIAGYLAEHLGPTINVNTAGAIDFQLGFWITREQGEAIVAYRTEHGPFATPDDLRNVPGLDFTLKVEPIRDYLTF